MFITAFAGTWPSVSQFGSALTYAAESTEISTNASKSSSSSVPPSVLTFASARVLASELSSASTYTSPSVSPCVSAFDYASASLGVLISAFASNCPSVPFTVLICTLATVSAQVYTT